MKDVKSERSEQALDFVESLNIKDMDIETLEQRLELAATFDATCYLNATCGANCSSNVGDPTNPL